jgi:CheY-like chemotaxis protein
MFKVVGNETVFPLRVMVCGSDPLAARELGRLVHDAGYDVCVVAGCAGEALEAAAEHWPDLVIADTREGGGDALITAVKIRARCAIPCIVVARDAEAASHAHAAHPVAILTSTVGAATIAGVMAEATDHLIVAA